MLGGTCEKCERPFEVFIFRKIVKIFLRGRLSNFGPMGRVTIRAFTLHFFIKYRRIIPIWPKFIRICIKIPEYGPK